MNVQAFLNNVSFPKSLTELEYYVDEFDVETLLRAEWVEWTSPKWTIQGDIVFFFHAKTAIQQIRRLETALRTSTDAMSRSRKDRLASALVRARTLYARYGGKIFAIGRIAGRPFYDAHPFLSEEEEHEYNVKFRTSRHIFARVGEICLLEQPIDIAEFSDFIFVSRQSAITPVVGDDFERLKRLIAEKNQIPEYLENSTAIPTPLQKINTENWLEITRHYRRLFQLEIQFRRFYVDYFLRVLGAQKKFYAECECYKNGIRSGIADNIIKLDARWCFVEVKLNVKAEPHLSAQLQKYCNVENASARKEHLWQQEKLWQESVLVMDTINIYLYNAQRDELTLLKELDEIRTEEDIRALRAEILKRLK